MSYEINNRWTRDCYGEHTARRIQPNFHRWAASSICTCTGSINRSSDRFLTTVSPTGRYPASAAIFRLLDGILRQAKSACPGRNGNHSHQNGGSAPSSRLGTVAQAEPRALWHRGSFLTAGEASKHVSTGGQQAGAHQRPVITAISSPARRGCGVTMNLYGTKQMSIVRRLLHG